MKRPELVVEGVAYDRYVVHYVTSTGKRRTKVLYAPGLAWLRDTVDRWIYAADIDIKPGSNVRVSS